MIQYWRDLEVSGNISQMSKLYTFIQDELSSSKEMVDKVSIVTEIISKSLDQSISEECYEFLPLDAAASEKGKNSFYQPGVMDMLASHICTVQDGARSLEFAIKLLQLVLNWPHLDRINPENVAGLSHMVGAIARQFAVLHNAFKFDALHLLTILLSSKNTLLHNALRSMAKENWTSHVRFGVTTVLQNRVVSSEKLQGLLMAESMMSILGEGWLVEQTQFDDNQIQMQAGKVYVTCTGKLLELKLFFSMNLPTPNMKHQKVL